MKIILVAFVTFFSLALATNTFATPPMVEKHIFSPEPDEKGILKGDEKSPLVQKLERKILFTGVIVSPKGKWVMIKEKRARKGEVVKTRLKEGDEILGMTIQEIGPNYVVLSGEGKKVKMALYHGGKKRPSPPPEIQGNGKSPVKVKKRTGPSRTATKSSKSRASRKRSTRKPFTRRNYSPKANTGSSFGSGTPPGIAPSPPTNPFAEALRRAVEKRNAQGTTQPPPNNPFLEAIRRSQGK